MKARSHPLTCFLGRTSCAVALAAASGGCATRHEVRIDSLARPHTAPASYAIRVQEAASGGDSLRARELAGQVRAALGARGLYEAPPNTRPDMIVELECGVGPAELRPKRVVGSLNSPGPLAPPTRVQVGTDDDGRPIYRERDVIQARDGYYEIVPVYEKFLRVTARENVAATDGRATAEIWRIEVTTENESHDLRQALPILVAATIDHLGTDSHGQKTIRIKDTDPEVAAVRRGF